MSKQDDVFNKAIDIILTEAAEIANEQENAEIQSPCEEIDFSNEHEEKMKKLFKKEKRRIALKKISKYSKGIAAGVVAVVVVSGVAVMSVAKWRTEVMKFVFNDKDTHTEISFVEENEIVVAGGVCFKYIPEGFVVTEEDVSRTSTDVIFHDGITEISYHRTPIHVESAIDTENAIVKDIKINGMEGILSKKDTSIILVWHDEEYVYTMTSSGKNGPISEEKLVKIAQNIEKGQNF